MKKNTKRNASTKSASNNDHLPTYQELADLVCELVETNIANLDGHIPFVRCFTFDASQAPDHWHRALDAREALIASKIVPRQKRSEYDRKKIRPMASKPVQKAKRY